MGCTALQDGARGAALVLEDGSTAHRCRELVGVPASAQYVGGIVVEPGSDYQVIDDLPSVRITGGVTPGTTAIFETFAGAGTSARIFAGRQPQVVPFGSSLPILHTSERGVSLGAMDSTEFRPIPFGVPQLPRGTLVFVQTWRTRLGGQTDLSNAVVLIVR